MEEIEHGYYGFDIVDGKFVINELETETVKWLFVTSQAYTEHPPACL